MTYKHSLFGALVVAFSIALLPQSSNAQAEIVANFDELQAPIGNKAAHFNFWNGLDMGSLNESEGVVLDFVEYAQLMQATGGQPFRDLFKNPNDFSVRNDYDISRLVKACKQCLKNGMKPYIKFGIPSKLASSSTKGGFGMNPYPPDNYDEYYNYVSAICGELAKNFSKEELEKWRYCVLTEFDNKSWFVTKSGDPDETREAFLKLYDYTVDAVKKIISSKTKVGAHAMRSKDSFWDASALLEHCARGVNFKTGKKGSPIDFFAISYYDYDFRNPSFEQLGAIIQILRNKAEALGLNLTYGIDEGRILWGRKGKYKRDLLSRIVGDSYQIAFEARIAKEMADFNIDYFSSWSYSAGSPLGSYPHISYYTARSVSKFKNARRAKVERYIKKFLPNEVDALAGYDEQKSTANVLAYSYRRDENAKNVVETEIKLKSKKFANKEVDVSVLTMDDSANFFVKFREDRKKYDFKDSDFKWSPDSVQLDSKSNWINEEQYNFYKEKLRPEYVKISQLKPKSMKVKGDKNGEVTIQHKFIGNSAVFIECKVAKTDKQ